MNNNIKFRKGFIQIPLLIGIIVIIVASGIGTGIVLHKQERLSPFLADISQIFGETKEIINTELEEVESEELLESSEIEQKPEEVLQLEQELEGARLEAEKLKQELEKEKQAKSVQQQIPASILAPVPTPTPAPTPVSVPTPKPEIESSFSDFTITLNRAYELSGLIKKEPAIISFKGIEPSSYEINSNVKIEKTNTYRKIILRKVIVEYIGNMPDNEHYFEVGNINIQGSTFKTERQGNFIIWKGYKEINVGDDLDISIWFNVINKVGNYVQYQINKDGLYFYERIELQTQNVFQDEFIEKPIIIKGTFPILSDKYRGF